MSGVRTEDRRSLVVYVGDIHFREKRPRRRVDNPVQAISAKIRYIVRRAIELDAVAIVLGGDLGHSTVWSTALAGAVKRAFSGWREHCESDDALASALGEKPTVRSKRILTIVGNHDVPSYNYDHMEDTGIQACVDNGTVKILTEPYSIGDFEFWPFHSGQDETNALVEGTWVGPAAEEELEFDEHGDGEITRAYNPSRLQVGLVHAPVGPTSNPHMKDYRTLKIPFFDVVMFADIHDPFPPTHLIPGVTVANPGSICRWNILDADREVQFAIIYSDGEVVYEKIPCQPKDDVFDLTGITPEEIAEAVQKSTRGYLAAVAAAALNKDEMENRDFVRKIGEAAGFDERTIALLMAELPVS